MIDTLMMAYTVEMVSVEKVIACAQQYSSFFQATDLPYDIEDAVMFWINKVNEHLKDIMEQEQKLKEHHSVETPGGQKPLIVSLSNSRMGVESDLALQAVFILK
ncbi:UNVERIFIED_CONTAM: Calmodulin-regulated spectrin-associated protein 2 [Gekko kuhli]